MLCTVIANQDKWTTVIEHKVLGTSKHVDYSLFHWKAGDVAALKKPLTKFVFVDTDDEVIEVILASEALGRGQTFKTAKRDTAELTDVELAEVSGAIELVRSSAPTPPPAVAPVAAKVPKVILSPEAVMNGLAPVIAAAEAASEADTPAADAPAEGIDAAAEPASAGVEAEAPAVDDPPSNVTELIKPSRKHRRR
jgi:hypothetical protein